MELIERFATACANRSIEPSADRIMVQTCSKCSRANPEEANYCYFDGFVLGSHSRNGGPVAIGAQAFVSPFVFPTGRTCRSFDELAIGCQEDWSTARDLLQEGFLEGFFGGIGRVDLVRAAKEAGKFPDRDRGLDQLLAKLPSEVLAPPHLNVETQEINLGLLKIGSAREFDLHMENGGMRLLYGSVTVTDQKPWLTLGDIPGTTEKHFQFNTEQNLKIKVSPDRLRASNRPLESKLIIDSNGGRMTVLVRAECHVKPFPPGVLGGAKSPRQVAEKAKGNPKEAAALFEKGEVADWYKSNGWTYPVQGPSASGVGAVQQFFEALGLTAPPKVEIDTREITLEGNPGETLARTIEVKSKEKRPVFAHATCDQDWVKIERAKLNGRIATINVSFPVPNQPGRALTAHVHVQSNGNQRFDVPITLNVLGNAFDFASPAPAAVETVMEASGAVATAAVLDRGDGGGGLESMLQPSGEGAATVIRKPSTTGSWPWKHLVPAGLLVLALVGMMIYDIKRPLVVVQDDGPVEVEESSGRNFTDLADPEPRLKVIESLKRKGCFGLLLPRQRDPKYPEKAKRLTYQEDGSGNNTIVKIDDFEYYFGRQEASNRLKKFQVMKDGRGMVAGMDFGAERIYVEEHVEIVPGASRLLDTCLVYFKVTNNSGTKHNVGVRILLDTFIGANDGVPFTIPGHKGFMEGMKEYNQKEIPDYIEVIEDPDNPKDLGTVARLGLKGIRLEEGQGDNRTEIDVESIDKMRICLYPGDGARWDWEMEPMNKTPTNKDSCVALYWYYRSMNPGETRYLAFTYGLSELSDRVESTLSLSAPASIRPNSTFRLTSYVWNAKMGQQVKLELPPGLTLVQGESDTKTIEEAGRRVQVSWEIKAGAAGKYPVRATSGMSATRPFNVHVKSGTIFGSD
jgi:hypothetical protein